MVSGLACDRVLVGVLILSGVVVDALGPHARVRCWFGCRCVGNDGSCRCDLLGVGGHLGSGTTSASRARCSGAFWPAIGCCCTTSTRPPGSRCAGPNPSATRSKPLTRLVHVDIKKLCRIPNGGRWRMLGRQAGNHNNKKQGLGYAFLHHTVGLHLARLLRATRQRTQGNHGSILGPCQGVLHRAEHHRHHGDDRQQLLLSVQSVLRHTG